MKIHAQRPEAIHLRKVSVNNLKAVDLDIPYRKLVALCGLSGSGKSSLAIDTLYAEGQRRYIESFSAYTRQFLERLEKPDAEKIEGIQPAVAVTSREGAVTGRSTIGTTTETADYLRLLFAKIGSLRCHTCSRPVKQDSPESILRGLEKLPNGTRVILAFAPTLESFRAKRPDEFQRHWRERGFQRGIVLGETFRLDEGGIPFDKFAEAQLFALADQFDDTFDRDERENDPEKEKNGEYFDPEQYAQAEEELFADSDGSSEGEVEENDAETSQNENIGDSAQEGVEREGTREQDDSLSNRIMTIQLDSEAFLAHCMQKWKDSHKTGGSPPLFFISDRIVIGTTSTTRIRESLEAAFSSGEGCCWLFFEGEHTPSSTSVEPDSKMKEDGSSEHDQDKSSEEDSTRFGIPYTIDGARWTLCGYSRRLRCEDCGIEYPKLEPNLFNFNSPLGACPLCEGFGNLMMLEIDRIIPDKRKTLKERAIAPWNTPSYRYKYDELFAIAEELNLRTDVPISELTSREMDMLVNGSRRTKFDGLNGFFRRLQRQKYKMHIRVFLSRWRSYRVCPLCGGSRLRPEALAVTIGGKNIDQITSMTISESAEFFRQLQLSDWEKSLGKFSLLQIGNRLNYLDQVGLGYLTLQRPMRTLSEGEQRRAALTSVLGSSLVDMLYILDEPSVGLHPNDTQQLLKSILSLRDRGNTVVAVEHEPALLEASDRIIEIGPGAGQSGGEVVFQGTYDEICRCGKSLTGNYLSGKRGSLVSKRRRILENGFIELKGASGHNLKKIHAVFPLGLLCLVTGVSGSGKSTLIQETLYPALCKNLARTTPIPPLPYENLIGTRQIDDVVLVDQTPIGRSPRSNPATYLKIFDDIRAVFASTPDAKANGYNAGYFSFNVDGGRCNTCKGEGYLKIDMQFMADMFVKCPQCGGHRYQRDILNILYRGKNIAEVLAMTAREAFSFFRSQPKIQQKLKRLMDVGLDYIQLGQPANTLSGGESQRLKLVAYLLSTRKERTLFLMDEPTTGLHFADIVQLLDCFDALLETGHSLIVIEHNLQMMCAADYIIDLGPGSGENGGRIIAEGTPEQIARSSESVTGRYLAKYLH